VGLDPFCGCGTAVHAAQKLKRKWIGIDITHLAISLIEKRLKDAFRNRVKFDVIGTPGDLEAARDLAQRSEHDGRYQFQYWAVSLVEANPAQNKKKGADGGVDGIKFFRDLDKKEAHKIVVSVKSVKLKPDETVVFSWIVYKSRAQRDAINKKAMADPRLADMMDPKAMPFDGKRMFWGGFKGLVEF